MLVSWFVSKNAMILAEQFASNLVANSQHSFVDKRDYHNMMQFLRILQCDCHNSELVVIALSGQRPCQLPASQWIPILATGSLVSEAQSPARFLPPV